MNEYYSEYSQRPTQNLKDILGSLQGISHATTPARIECVECVLKERGECVEAEVDAASIERSLDEVVATRFLNKLKNARQRNLDFTLTLAHMKKLVTRKSCYYTGMKLRDDVDAKHPSKRTIERLDSSKGYTVENTVACCHAANSLKNLVLECGGGELAMTKKQLQRMVGKL